VTAATESGEIAMQLRRFGAILSGAMLVVGGLVALVPNSQPAKAANSLPAHSFIVTTANHDKLLMEPAKRSTNAYICQDDAGGYSGGSNPLCLDVDTTSPTQLQTNSGQAASEIYYTSVCTGCAQGGGGWPFALHTGWDSRYAGSPVMHAFYLSGPNAPCMRTDAQVPLGAQTSVYMASGGACGSNPFSENTLWVIRGDWLVAVAATDENGGSGGNPWILMTDGTGHGKYVWAEESSHAANNDASWCGFDGCFG
jgi:hypothetical protein